VDSKAGLISSLPLSGGLEATQLFSFRRGEKPTAIAFNRCSK